MQMYEINKRVKEGKPTMDLTHFSPKVFIGDIATEVGNDQGLTVRKLAQAHGVLSNIVTLLYKRI
jgi:hypothetical protein